MRLGKFKDIFVVHTKRFQIDNSVFVSLAEMIIPLGFSVWGYEDWDWIESIKRSGWRDSASRDGFIADLTWAIEDDFPNLPRKADLEILDELISISRAVLFLNPSSGDLTSGMVEELFSLRRDRRQTSFREKPVSSLCWCSFEDNPHEPYPLDFGDGHKVKDNWNEVFSLPSVGNTISTSSLIQIAIIIVKMIVEQRIQHVLKKRKKGSKRSKLGPGWLIKKSFDFHISPTDELSRAKKALHFFQSNRNQSAELDLFILEYEKLITSITEEDLDEDR